MEVTITIGEDMSTTHDMFACRDPRVPRWLIATPEWLAANTAVQEGALLVMGGTFLAWGVCCCMGS